MSINESHCEWCYLCNECWYASDMKLIKVTAATPATECEDGTAYFCEECKPELFKEEKRMMTLISHVDYNGEIDTGSLKNPANETYVKFLTELTSLFAKYEYSMRPMEECFISIIDKNCNNVAWFYDIFGHDDVADDYILEAKVGNKLNGEFDLVEITVTRACCANSSLETTCVDYNKGIGYTVCNNCRTKRDWR